MNRPLVAVLAGLALLAQTTAMAWASHGSPAQAEPAAAVESMPCHGDAADAGDEAAADPAAPCDCCDGGCLFACGGAPLPAIQTLTAVDPPGHPSTVAPVLAPLASHSLSPFRPPAA